jgi:hypothetical protein
MKRVICFSCFTLSRIPWPLWAIPPAFSEAGINYFCPPNQLSLFMVCVGLAENPRLFYTVMDSGSINAPDLCSSLRSQLFVSD